MRLDFGINPLIRAADQRVAFFDVGVDAAVAARPIGVLTKQADAAGDKEVQVALIARLKVRGRLYRRQQNRPGPIGHGRLFGQSKAGYHARVFGGVGAAFAQA